MSTGLLEKRFGIEKTIDLIADAGFDGLDYTDDNGKAFLSDNYKEEIAFVLKKAKSRSLKFYQTHAPIAGRMIHEGGMELLISSTIHSLEIASLLGAEAAVVHPIQDDLHKMGDNCVYEKNMAFFSSLLPYCEQFNVKIAIENMIKSDKKTGVIRDGVCAHPLEFIKYIDDLNSPFVTGCFDTGHCSASGREPQDFLRVVGNKYITCMHIHDNDYRSDKHALPCTMDLNWDEICKAMAEIKYDGHFTLEAVNFLNKYTDDFIPTALKFKYDTARYLVNKIKKHI